MSDSTRPLDSDLIRPGRRPRRERKANGRADGPVLVAAPLAGRSIQRPRRQLRRLLYEVQMVLIALMTPICIRTAQSLLLQIPDGPVRLWGLVKTPLVGHGTWQAQPTCIRTIDTATSRARYIVALHPYPPSPYPRPPRAICLLRRKSMCRPCRSSPEAFPASPLDLSRLSLSRVSDTQLNVLVQVPRRCLPDNDGSLRSSLHKHASPPQTTPDADRVPGVLTRCSKPPQSRRMCSALLGHGQRGSNRKERPLPPRVCGSTEKGTDECAVDASGTDLSDGCADSHDNGGTGGCDGVRG
ncbi:hypothetical protein CH63R_13090 [Colletotrichum higginsianum IMI 349063]|uniref:Uncharacterized protein n=1 Tax=Colletotrichum higginsianum (strain IMI 349063) TaxID=759273 RepID=A0A1B7XW45_COLHI|nr:hypothetical protein CH63R_13090 [Colletotrichum higginsianum IMI 349063]OBR03963.1 hypothetical protein CH63R_13090 [Colletotrichum higginsianum IMI 349063]